MKRVPTGRAAWLAGLAALLVAANVAAADLRLIEVDRVDDVYTMKSVAWFEAGAPALFEVLTDYNLFSEFSSAIVESKNLGTDASGRPGYYTRMEGCVLMFCHSFVRIGHLSLKPIAEIVAVTDPVRSDFKMAEERWQLIPEKHGTLLIYEFEMQPDFWVPPVIGPFYIKRALRSGGADAVDRIEALALRAEH